MFRALLGSVTSLAALSSSHDRQIARLDADKSREH
jgi:hypothetical protein